MKAPIAQATPLMPDEGQDAASRLRAVEGEISHALRDSRRADAVTMIAISKTHAAPAIRPLIAAGQRHFGENRVQEAAEKWPELRAETPGLTLHMVGQLQSNKAEEAVALFDVIHSLDRPSLLAALVRAMGRTGRRIPLFIQVNLAAESQKGGCSVADLPGLIAAARAQDIQLAGLMTVPPATLEPAPWFALLAKLADDHGLPGLSMGMSADYGSAIRIGATHVRVGSALFGQRPPA
jgi:PLP dependent protein